MDWNQLFDDNALQDLQVAPTLLNLVLVLALGQVLALHYRAFAKVLSNKRKFAPILVFIAATTMLVISVVKTSLALSLGLVGALSIIRFRTPIKEPLELAYLFLAVAVGVGLGADQRLATVIMFVGILAYMTILTWKRGGSDPARTLLHVSAELGGRGQDEAVEALVAAIGPHAAGVDLRRVDLAGGTLEATLTVDLAGSSSLGPLLRSVVGPDGAFPGASASFVDADGAD